MRPSSARTPISTITPRRTHSGISSVTIEASIGLMVLAGQRDESRFHRHEPVARERVDRLAVELADRPRVVRHEAERRRPPLAERALEPALPAQRLEAAAARRAVPGERALVAARDACEADGRAEIHQR